jgi:hypothetical protein
METYLLLSPFKVATFSNSIIQIETKLQGEQICLERV